MPMAPLYTAGLGKRISVFEVSEQIRKGSVTSL